MLVFGHVGITFASAVLLEGIIFRKQPIPRGVGDLIEQSPLSSEESLPKSSHRGITLWITSLAERIDLRLLLIGSLLPDIVDIPIGFFFFRDTFNNTRIFCHTLLFLLVITFGGLYLYWSRKKTWLLVLSFGTFTHLVLDFMWRTPRTLFWPFYGLSFDKYEPITLIRWIQNLLNTFLKNPIVGIPELLGVVVVIWLVWLLVHQGKLYSIIKNGRI